MCATDACRAGEPVYHDAGPLSQPFCTGEIMSRNLQTVALLLTLLALSSISGQAGGDKASAWKQFVPAPAYEALSQRSLERIGKMAKDDKASLQDLRAEAVILAGYTMSVKDRQSLAGMRAA